MGKVWVCNFLLGSSVQLGILRKMGFQPLRFRCSNTQGDKKLQVQVVLLADNNTWVDTQCTDQLALAVSCYSTFRWDTYAV